MAQLPPKIPNWPDFSHQKTCTPTSWVDEFLDFSSVRRGAHRRSSSDSITFLEAPHHDHYYDEDDERLDRLDHHGPLADEEQLFISMFSNHEISSTTDVVGPTFSSACNSALSDRDHNSVDDDDDYNRQLDQFHQPKNEVDEVQSSEDRIFDPKRVKRILSNRQSAQRSRVRKLQYISELERSVNTLQAEVSVLSPRVAFLDHQRLLLNVDNSALKQRIAALAQDKLFKDAHQEALKREIERLRQVYHHQLNVNKSERETPSSSPTRSDTNGAAEKEEEIQSI